MNFRELQQDVDQIRKAEMIWELSVELQQTLH